MLLTYHLFVNVNGISPTIVNEWTRSFQIMVNRKFSDSEIRAFTKNRHEEKVLKTKLQKLNDEFGFYHEFSAKQRTLLLTENKNTCRTSGDSTVSQIPSLVQNKFDISKRFRRPWAYSVMETTHNVKYKEAVIPLPKPKYRRVRSKSEAALHVGSGGLRGRNTELPPGNFSSLQRSKSCISRIITGSDSNRFDRIADTTPLPNEEHEKLNPLLQREKGDPCQTGRSQNSFFVTKTSLQEESYPVIIDTKQFETSADKICALVDDIPSNIQPCIEDSFKLERFQLNELFDVEKRHDLMMPKVIILPRVYETENSTDFQRRVRRSRSRVNFGVSDSPGIKEIEAPENFSKREKMKQDSSFLTKTENDSEGDCHVTNENHKTISKEMGEKVLDSQDGGNSGNDLLESSPCKSRLQKRYYSQRSLSAGALIIPSNRRPEEADSNQSRDVFYKGRRLKNYIKPEERYKLDPLIVRRRQMKMDRLAKESVTYLARINHENLSVEIAFPRAARSRILQQLIKENNSCKNQLPLNPDAELLKIKTEEFLTSISKYIARQKEET